MSVTPGGGVRIWDGTESAFINAASAAQAASIDAKVVRSFTTPSTRNSAWGSSAPEGTPAYVQDSGLSFYDGNARTGTNGWTWAAPRLIVNRQGILGATASTTSDEITNSGDIVVPSKRLLHVTTSAKVWADSGNAIGRVFLLGTNVSVPPSDQQFDVGAATWNAGLSGATTRQHVSFSFYVAAGPSSGAAPISFSYRILRVGGSNTNAVYAEAVLQVVDMGPHD